MEYVDGDTENRTFMGCKFRRLVCRATDKNKIKTGESDISESLYIHRYI